MSRLTLLCALLTFPYFAFSQGSSSSAVVITPAYYFDASPGVATFTNHSLVSTTGEVFPSCAGSQTVYWFKFNIPTPANSTLSTKSVKIEITGAAFTPVIDFFDASLVWKECISGAVLRTDPVANPVTPTNDYYIRVSSTTPAAGSAFNIGVQYYPVAELRSGYYPTLTADPNGYATCDQTRRNNVAATGTSLVQATRFTFTPTTTPNSGSCSYVVNSNSSILLLDQMSCVCYGINYEVLVELKVDNHWCGTGTPRPLNMQVGGITSITTPTNSTLQFNESLTAQFACTGAVYQWEFTTQNGSSISYSTTSPSIQLDQISCLRFNRIYQARVRIIACGITGPWCGIDGEAGTPCIIFTPPLYTIPVPTAPIGSGPGPNNFCYSQVLNTSAIDVDYYPGIDQYIFQFTRVNNAAPFNPISNPVIVFSTASICSMSAGGCIPGRTYRVGIKPGISASACAPAQQGDYSPWCYFSVSPAAAPVPGMMVQPDNVFVEYETFEKTENLDVTGLSFEVIGNNASRMLVVSTNDQEISGRGYFNLYDINGRLVHTLEMNNASGATVLQLDLPQELPTGIYVAQVSSNSTIQTSKIFLAAN